MTIFSWFNQNKTQQISDSNEANTGKRLSKDNLIPLHHRGKTMWPIAKVRLIDIKSSANDVKATDSVTAITDISERLDSDLVGEKYVIND
ncbi:hypothetical protein FE810_06620 [Thalassotalea litorea]|uniref:Uncharacterized protein n=1 Tax=Thalassotalea litorea TaxID=2020715 RepID=A0A5R9IP42_9GAMM|nr:hypothetical protein [Thalassotalea litorea]TLU66359.1 hypothetical protein FE810_06620 [Thalassotalea litorea]